MEEILTKSNGYTKAKKKLGRGNSSGKGNYSGRGIKGQKSRSGYSKRPGFEGGQTPLNKRLPKLRGFKRFFKLVDNYDIVNLKDLENDDRISENIDKAVLKQLGYIKSEKSKVKLLGDGDITKKLTITGLDKCSKSAKEKIENAGGTVS
ncbi:50S ribosomal protein L15 [Candidatus Absconditicoccus praedator]|uniref:50S ribosomal protein L15 n=1 Tax=Candidatus Absconditicoccus praedator TaxID=2735562 RepID=UPI001E4E8D2B|nr:50S ribosomal protein L15 [Candidatus Absconditicoccus praedator]UFX82771.1 50S ribosomal protein L15 [Candidatus Absconditicoccus praedator]